MLNYKDTLGAMKRERASMKAELDRLDKAISALQGLVGRGAPSRPKPIATAKKPAPTPRVSQPANKPKTKAVNKPRPKISAQGLRNIVEAQRKRWAKVRAAKAQAKPVSATKATNLSKAK